MANEQNSISQNPSPSGPTSSPENKSGQQNAAATQTKKESSAPNGQDRFQLASTESPKADSGGASNQSLLDQAKNTAGQAYEAVAEKAATKLNEQKATLSGGLASVAGSIRKVGENLQGSDVQDGIGKYTREYTSAAAQKIEQAADYFESKDVKSMYRDVENFARRNPAVFIGGAFALGVLAARFLKSTNPRQLTNAAGQTFGSERTYREGFGSGKAGESASQLH